MDYCIKCGAKINDGVRFCSQCGTPIENNNIINNIDEVNLVEQSLNQSNKGVRISKILVGIVVLTMLFFIGKSFFLDSESSEKSFSTTEQLKKLEGKWHDPTGVILGNKEAIIVFKQKGDIVTGKDKKGLFKAQITPFGANNYQAIVMLQNVESDFSLHFYEEENKLVFFSTFTKSSWYLKKMN